MKKSFFIFFFQKWVPEVKHHCPESKLLIVGTKIDLREDPDALSRLRERNLEAITEKEGRELASSVNAVCYVECSALTQKGLKIVFDEGKRINKHKTK